MYKTEKKEVEELIDVITEDLSCVILYNDELHSFDEVIFQLILATNCTLKRAEQMTYEVHSTGQSRVYNGTLEECLGVSAILEDIALKTEIVH